MSYSVTSAFGFFPQPEKYHKAYFPNDSKGDVLNYLVPRLEVGHDEGSVGHLKGYIPFFSLIHASTDPIGKFREIRRELGKGGDDKVFYRVLLIRRIFEFVPFAVLMLAPIDGFVTAVRFIRAVWITPSAKPEIIRVNPSKNNI